MHLWSVQRGQKPGSSFWGKACNMRNVRKTWRCSCSPSLGRCLLVWSPLPSLGFPSFKNKVCSFSSSNYSNDGGEERPEPYCPQDPWDLFVEAFRRKRPPELVQERKEGSKPHYVWERDSLLNAENTADVIPWEIKHVSWGREHT